MGIETKISWTSRTWNPYHGCKKISSGCHFCYMFRDKERYGQDPTTVIRSKTFNDPLRWHKKLTGDEPFSERLVFTCSWSDFFIRDADEWRDEAWAIIKQTPHLIYQILTKRPERIAEHLPADWGEGYPNVWLGVSVEDQRAANTRIDTLITVPAQIHFISIEPLLESIHLPLSIVCLDWAIVGGESGNETGKYRYRPSELAWYHSVVDKLKAADVAIWVKQLGTDLAKRYRLSDRHGANIAEFPAALQIQDFPRVEGANS